MADESDDEKQKRLQLEEFQREQATEAVRKSQANQPAGEVQNAVQRLAQQEQEHPVQLRDYTARGLPTGGTLLGGSRETGIIPTEQQAQERGIGSYIDKFGQHLGYTTDLSGYPLPKPEGAVGQQGRISPQEEQFWAANPMGAILDEHGMLIGLGSTDASRRTAYWQATPDIQKQRIIEAAGRPPEERTPTFNDFLDPVIQARRDELASERATIMEHMKTASTARGMHGRNSPSDLEVERMRLQAVEHADAVLQREQFTQAQLKATVAHQNFTLQRQTNTANQTSGFFAELSQVKSPIGTPEHAAEVVAIAQRYPYAMRTKEARDALKEHADLHDSTSQLIANAQAQGKIVTQTGISASGKPTYKVTDPNVVPTSVEQRYIRLQASIQQHLEQSDAEQKANVAGKKANIPYSKAAALHADQAEADAIAQRYPSLMPKQAAPPESTPSGLRISSDAEYNNLPSGSIFIDPNGVKRRKP